MANPDCINCGVPMGTKPQKCAEPDGTGLFPDCMWRCTANNLHGRQVVVPCPTCEEELRFERYLVIAPREGNPDLYLLTKEQWERYMEHRKTKDVYMAALDTFEGEEPPYFLTMEKLFDHVRKHGWVLYDGEVGIGY